MRRFVTLLAFLCLFAMDRACADQVRDVDQWAKEFTDAAGRTDTDGMTKLIRPYAIPSFDMHFLEDNDPKLRAFADAKKVVLTEQFDNAQVGHFMRRINVAVIYEDRQLFYSIWFVFRGEGWKVYHYLSTATLAEVRRVDWP